MTLRHLLFVLLAACGAPSTPGETAATLPVSPPPTSEKVDALKTAPANLLFEWHRVETAFNGALRGVAAGDGWAIAVGDEGAVFCGEFPYRTWTRVSSGTLERLHAIVCDTGVSTQNVCIAVGDRGTILRSDGKGAKWVSEPSVTTENLYGVELAMAHERPFFYAVGANGTIVRRDPKTRAWSAMKSPTHEALRSVSSVEASHHPTEDTMHAVGDHGTAVMLSESGEWQLQTTRTREDLLATDVTLFEDAQVGGPPNVYELQAVGTHGAMLHTPTGHDEWTAERLDTSVTLNAIDTFWWRPDASPAWPLGKPQRVIVAVGARGTVLARNEPGREWVRLTDIPTSADLLATVDLRTIHVVVGAAGTVLVVLVTNDDKRRWSSP
jgi:hypothetical protein